MRADEDDQFDRVEMLTPEQIVDAVRDHRRTVAERN